MYTMTSDIPFVAPSLSSTRSLGQLSIFLHDLVAGIYFQEVQRNEFRVSQEFVRSNTLVGLSMLHDLEGKSGLLSASPQTVLASH